MKIAAWVAGVIVLLVVGLIALQYVASERVEVVALHTRDSAGEEIITRLWVVDYEGSAYLRVGSDGSGWFSRLSANPEIQVERHGKLEAYLAVPRPELSDEINQLMQEKYTWGDSLIGYLVGSRENSVPVELQPR